MFGHTRGQAVTWETPRAVNPGVHNLCTIGKRHVLQNCFIIVLLKTVSTFVKLSQLIISLQRKPEEESPRKDDAKKAKQEPEVNGGSGDTISSGTEVSENMEEEVGS